jgi:formylglycine-generating enzyme required for sulfatase activity
MNYPLITEYKQAIADPENSFKDLLPLEPLRKGNDWHFAAGNFATVFKMRKPDDDSHLAVKCFTRHVAGREERQQAVVAYIKAHPKPYFINYQYLPNELFVDSQAAGAKEYPLVAMPWVEGWTLYEEVQSFCNAQNKTALKILADKFCGLGHDLLAQSFAHGDLKHDNILVRPDGQLVLVDYDGMYVPDLNGQQANEMGGTDYQHPARCATHFDCHLDDFSIAIIALSLFALAEQPQLFGKHSQGNHLLISRQDLQNPMASPLMQELELSNDLTVHKLLSLLKSSLLSSELHLANLPKILPEGGIPKTAKIKTHGILLPEMVFVEGGTFMMGATPEQGDDAEDHEKPAHQVTLDNFEIGKYAITNEQFCIFLNAYKSDKVKDGQYKGETIITEHELGVRKNSKQWQPREGFEQHPVIYVSWYGAYAYSEWLSTQTGEKFRLPTEAEWEYAARGGRKSRGYKFAGSNDVNDVAWYENNSRAHTHPVGQKESNELNLYDMSGNIWEWCNDWYDSEGYQYIHSTNPNKSINGVNRVCRGGSWYSNPHGTRVSDRYNCQPDLSFTFFGFRIVKAVEIKTHNMPLPEMVFVEGGTFMMGATPEQGDDAEEDEKPAHQVTLDSFEIGKYPVTQAQWKAVMGNYRTNPSHFKNCPEYPVEGVSWYDVQEFIQRLNTITGETYRMPTEAEWEYAARGGNKSKGYKYAGTTNNLNDYAWYTENSGETYPVGQKLPNELSIYDMSGNIEEWCYDNHAIYSSNPKDFRGDYKVLRGGLFSSDACHARVSCRSKEFTFRKFLIGFRLCKTIETKIINIPPPEMVFVEGGTFMMGATEEQGDDARDNEKPARQVTLDSFEIGKYPVTQAQWQTVMSGHPIISNPNLFKNCPEYPMGNVSWNDVQEFIQKLNRITGETYRLPTDAEWEYAARGGKKSKGYKYAGTTENLGDYAWYHENTSQKGNSYSHDAHSVGQKSPNELGLYDMSGNVWEMCYEWDEDVYDFMSHSSGMLRGGSRDTPAHYTRVSHQWIREVKASNVGFRLCKMATN